MAVTCGVPGFVPAPGTKPQVNAQCDVSEERMLPKTNACSPVNSQLGAGHEPAGGSVDRVDNNRVRGVAGADRGDGVLPSYAPAGAAGELDDSGGEPSQAGLRLVSPQRPSGTGE